jgi:hypothetical protein
MSESPDRHSASADAAAVRWSELHPDEDLVEHPPPATPPEPDDEVPNRHSASAESAAERLRLREVDESV